MKLQNVNAQILNSPNLNSKSNNKQAFTALYVKEGFYAKTADAFASVIKEETDPDLLTKIQIGLKQLFELINNNYKSDDAILTSLGIMKGGNQIRVVPSCELVKNTEGLEKFDSQAMIEKIGETVKEELKDAKTKISSVFDDILHPKTQECYQGPVKTPNPDGSDSPFYKL